MERTVYDFTEKTTIPAPAGRPCGQLFCGFVAIAGTDRCERHKPTIKMKAVLIEAFQEACR